MDLRVKVRVSVRFGGAIRNSSLESFLLVFVRKFLHHAKLLHADVGDGNIR